MLVSYMCPAAAAGRSSENIDKKRCGKSPLSLVDLKAGIVFLAFCGCVPGDMEKIVSVGISAGRSNEYIAWRNRKQ